MKKVITIKKIFLLLGILFAIILTNMINPKLSNNIINKVALNVLKDTSSNLSNSINSIKSQLDNDDIYDTNLFNCKGTAKIECTTSSYSKIGVISLDEYLNLEGDNENSYLYNSNAYYLLNDTTLVTNQNKEAEATSEHIRPSVYIKGNVKVTGSGSPSNPFVIEKQPKKDINFISYNYEGTNMQESFAAYRDLIGKQYSAEIKCDNGSVGIISKNRIEFTTYNAPDYCTIEFKDMNSSSPTNTGKIWVMLTDGYTYSYESEDDTNPTKTLTEEQFTIPYSGNYYLELHGGGGGNGGRGGVQSARIGDGGAGGGSGSSVETVFYAGDKYYLSIGLAGTNGADVIDPDSGYIRGMAGKSGGATLFGKYAVGGGAGGSGGWGKWTSTTSWGYALAGQTGSSSGNLASGSSGGCTFNSCTYGNAATNGAIILKYLGND